MRAAARAVARLTLRCFSFFITAISLINESRALPVRVRRARAHVMPTPACDPVVQRSPLRVRALTDLMVAGRVMFKRAGGKGLVFYDIVADGVKLQVFADARNFSAFQGDDGLGKFMKLMNETKVSHALSD